MWERVMEIVRKEFRQTLREPRMRGILIGPPLLQMIVFGFAVNLDVTQVRLGWMDLDHSVESNEIRQRFVSNRTFIITAEAGSEREAQDLLDRGTVQGVVRIAPGFGADTRGSRQTEIQVLLDGANSNTAAIVGNYAAAVIATRNKELLMAQQTRKLVGRTQNGPILLRIPSVQPERRVWFNPELKSRNYFVPGIIVNIITLVTLMLTALSIVREKEIGTMEQIMVTPITSAEFILGKTVPFALIGFADVILITLIGVFWFEVPIRGSLVLLFVATALYLLTTLAIGLLISTVSQTQQQAMMSTFFFYFPAVLLSGFMFPIANMPEVVQWLTYLNPLRHFLVIIRGIFLKGVGPSVLWPQMLALAVMGCIALWLAAKRFHKTLA